MTRLVITNTRLYKWTFEFYSRSSALIALPCSETLSDKVFVRVLVSLIRKGVCEGPLKGS